MAATKKTKIVLAQPAVGAPTSRLPFFSRAPGPVRGAGDEAAHRASLRHRSLLQDYQELIKETQAKKERLYMERLRKKKLLAEVKFLRKRYQSMAENPSQTIACRVKNPALSSASWRAASVSDAQHQLVRAVGSSSRNQLVQPRRGGSPRVYPAIDLNEACEPGYEMEIVEERHGNRAPLGINKSKRYPMESDADAGNNSKRYPMEMGSDAVAGPTQGRMPVFWDVQNPAGRSGKRKISCQDQR
ncbi:hypothetical protein Zm00014a_005317 [Zea mays]|uniref:Uncharacterized protein n=1 Tax=Zea mays TaxID=4577 RepID=A0A3L6F965_MAIZE|nr:hypothetical protein Zm00014a_005317 [Zea mays]